MAGLHWASRMGHHRSNVIYNVNATIKANLSKGSTYKEMSDTLSKALNGDVLQPMRIIRTESARVYSSAKMQSLDKCRQSGVDMVKIWHSSKDERVRSQHREMDGAVVDYDDVFTFPDGITTKAPCQSGAAHHDIHCRCFITVDLKEFYQDKDLQSSKTDDDENTNLLANTAFKDNTEYWEKSTKVKPSLVQDLQEYSINGSTYKVDGKHILLDYSKEERKIAEIIAKEYGKSVKMVPRVVYPKNIKTPDYIIDGIQYDLKTPIGKGKNTIYDMIKGKSGQSKNFIVNISKTKLSFEQVDEQIKYIYKSKHTKFVDEVLVVEKGKILKSYKRKK